MKYQNQYDIEWHTKKRVFKLIYFKFSLCIAKYGLDMENSAKQLLNPLIYIPLFQPQIFKFANLFHII